jgi:hypothetical protein
LNLFPWHCTGAGVYWRWKNFDSKRAISCYGFKKHHKKKNRLREFSIIISKLYSLLIIASFPEIDQSNQYTDDVRAFDVVSEFGPRSPVTA